jgi:hypothetical protein
MKWPSGIRSFKRKKCGKQQSWHDRRRRPILEELESRLMPSVYGQPVYLSGLTPWPNTSDLAGQTGTNHLNSAVEPSIATDPNNPLHMVTVWQQDRWSDGGSRGIMAAVTTDGGATWTDTAIPGVSEVTGGPLPRVSDPWVSFSPNGTVYVSTLALVGDSGSDETIYISKSMDGGFTWGAPTALISDTDAYHFDDKDSLTADPTNSNYVYVTWDRLIYDPTTSAFVNGPAMLARSTDGGQTWTNSVIFAGGTNTQTFSNEIVVLPNGTLLDVFDYADFNANTDTLEVARSIDHGATWSAPITVAAKDSIGVTDPNTGRGVRAGALDTAVNRSTGAVYIVWMDERFSGFTIDGIAISQSTDGGSTWSTPSQVNQTPTNIPSGDQQAFDAQVAVADNGVIAVTYYDFRNNTGGPGLATDYWVAFSNPGPDLSFGNEQRLTPSSFNTELAHVLPGGYMVGDYMGLAAGGMSFNTFATTFEETLSAQIPSRMAFENISQPQQLVVTNTTDDPNNPAQGSLRWAIEQANNYFGPSIIHFDIAPGGEQTIAPVAPLLTITSTVTLDATTQPGYAGRPLIQIDGANSGSGAGLVITSANCIVRGLVIDGFAGDGIDISGAGASGNVIQDDYIGTDFTGTAAVANGGNGIGISGGATATLIDGGNVISGNSGDGVLMSGAGVSGNIVANNYIGISLSGNAQLANGGNGVAVSGGATGNTIGRGNVISGNGGDGVLITGAGTSQNTVAYNAIGTNHSLTGAIANAGSGIEISNGASNNTIGGAGSGNLISGNAGNGVRLSGVGVTGNVVAGNGIGSAISGSAAVANGGNGVKISGGATGNLIGGSATADQNVISGNSNDGVLITDAGTNQNTVAGNYIGINAQDTGRLANGGNGIVVQSGASYNTIGGALAADGNVIGGNGPPSFNLNGPGIGIAINGAGTDHNWVAANYIGTDAAGHTGLGNILQGILILGGASYNLIGVDVASGGTAAERNVISGNGGSGIIIINNGTNDNVIAGNYLGITPDGEHALGNGQPLDQNVLSADVFINGGAQYTQVGTSGTHGPTLDALERNIISGGNTSAGGVFIWDSSNNHVAGNYIGTDATGTQILGNAYSGVEIASIDQVSQNNVIGAVASDPYPADEANVIAGNGFAGLASDQADPANAAGFSAGDDYAGYAGVSIVSHITDGSSTANFISANNTVWGNYIGTNPSGATGLGNAQAGIYLFGAQGTTIHGNLISGNQESGITIDGTFPTTTTTITDNAIGTNTSLTGAIPNAGPGIQIINGATNSTIGGSGGGNLISGNAGDGVLLSGAGVTGNVVANNYIGITISGNAQLANTGNGVAISGGATGNTIGGQNVISGNSADGVLITGSSTSQNTVAYNAIGTNHSGTGAIPNAGSGIQISNGASNNTIGGVASGAGNVISSNSGAGVEVLGAASVGNQIRGNSIYANGALGIDLGGDGVTPNHIGALLGPNNFQNYPVVSAARHGPTTRVVGNLSALPNTTYTLDFYASTSADPSGYGQGQRYLGSGQVTTDASGNATFDSNTFVTSLGASLQTEFITATATDPAGNTSEFSAAVQANAGPVAVNDSYPAQESSVNNSLNVLANDYDQVGDSFSIIATSTPGHGTATINGGNILYTPTAGFYGSDYFTYTICDAYGDASTATVNLSVNGLPVAVNDSYPVQQNSVNNTLNVLANDSDPDGDPLNIIATSTPLHGSASISGSNLLYTPAAGYYGSDSFTYTISDGRGATSTASVLINVNFRPVTISGTVFQDLNDDHIQDGSEPGLAGWTVQLDGGSMITTTNASGAYSFTGVGPGVHTISEVAQSAYIETSPRSDVFSIDTSNGLDVSGKNFSNEVPANARDNSLPGYSENGSGWNTLNSGWRGTSRTHVIDTSGKSFATWSLNVGSTIPPGNYEVFVSYVPAAGRATNAPYTIADNKTILATIAVDQTQTAIDGLYQGISWRSLGVFTFNSGKPILTLSANANGVIDADSVLLIPASAYAPPQSPLLAAALAPSNTAGSVSLPAANAGPARSAMEHMFSGLSVHQQTQGVWVGGTANAASVAAIDAAFADPAPDGDDFASALVGLTGVLAPLKSQRYTG